MNDVCHEIFSCMIEFGMVPLFSTVTIMLIPVSYYWIYVNNLYTDL